MEKNIYKCELKDFQGKLSKMGLLSQTIPVFSVSYDDTKIRLSIKNKVKEVYYSQIKKGYIWLSTGVMPLGTNQNIVYQIDLHLIIGCEEIILEFTHYRSLLQLIEILRSKNIIVEDKMGLSNIVRGSENLEKREEIIKYFDNNIDLLENKYGKIERNRLKNKYVGRF